MYDISRPEKITFDWLFDRINQEDVYLFYLGFCQLNKKFTNPLRKDSRADCSFYWYNGVLFFKDFAKNKAYTCIKIIMEIKSISYYSALDLIYNQFILDKGVSFDINKAKSTKPDKQYKDIQVKVQPFTSIDIEYLKSFGITKELCNLYKVFSVQHYWINGEIKYTYSNSKPCLGYYFSGKWKLYNYKSLDYRFVGNVSHSELQGFNQLEWIGDILIITKSLKDVMVYRKFGYNAVAPHSEGLASWQEKIEGLQKRFTKVILNFDNDKPGIIASKEVSSKYKLQEVFMPEEKDLSDYYKKFGYEQTKKMLNEKIK